MPAGEVKVVHARRYQVARLVARGAVHSREIASSLMPEGEPPSDQFITRIKNDIKWLRNQSVPWLDSLVQIGFIYECKVAVEKLQDIEKELQDIRYNIKDDPNVLKRVTVLNAIQHNINLQIETQANGPLLVRVRKLTNA